LCPLGNSVHLDKEKHNRSRRMSVDIPGRAFGAGAVGNPEELRGSSLESLQDLTFPLDLLLACRGFAGYGTTTAFFISIVEQLPRNDVTFPKVPENVTRWSLLSFSPNSFVIGNFTSAERNNSLGGSNVT
jgi:hypothetical protein